MTSQKYDVSICIANYNMEDTIHESLNSILEHIPDDYELVIVDESNDNSRGIIDSIRSENKLTKVYVSDLGYSASINRAVKEANGDIVLTHIDMDDWYDSRYFEAFIQLYVEIRESKGQDFWFSCPNFNMTGRSAYLRRYKLKELPLGAGEREYRWRIVTSGEFKRVSIDKKISERITMSKRKNIVSRVRRTYGLLRGLFQIGYTIRRVVAEEGLSENRPWYSKIFILTILPVAYATSVFYDSVNSSVSNEGQSLQDQLDKNTHTVTELQEIYDIEGNLEIDSLLNAD